MLFDVRDAQMRDAEGLARVQVDSYRTAYAGILPSDYLAHFTYEEQAQDWRDLLAQAERDLLLVALDGSSDLTGYALARPGPTDIAAYDGELVALHVRQRDQRRGIGTRLIGEASRRLHERGCRSLVLWTLEQGAARGFYEKLGGQLTGRRSFELAGVTPGEVAYGWPDITRLHARTRV
jgi:ribosomal protein S18 acetylase RimI-like enzyme